MLTFLVTVNGYKPIGELVSIRCTRGQNIHDEMILKHHLNIPEGSDSKFGYTIGKRIYPNALYITFPVQLYSLDDEDLDS